MVLHHWHFAWNIQFFLDKLFHKKAQKLRMSNYCCFRRGAQGQLYQCNVLRAGIKSHKGLKGTKVFA